MEPWHADIFDFLDLRKNHGKEEARARDLFAGLWVPDLFMRRVEAGGQWTLMCPAECPGLADCWGDEFDALYERRVRFRAPPVTPSLPPARAGRETAPLPRCVRAGTSARGAGGASCRRSSCGSRSWTRR